MIVSKFVNVINQRVPREAPVMLRGREKKKVSDWFFSLYSNNFGCLIFVHSFSVSVFFHLKATFQFSFENSNFITNYFFNRFLLFFGIFFWFLEVWSLATLHLRCATLQDFLPCYCLLFSMSPFSKNFLSYFISFISINLKHRCKKSSIISKSSVTQIASEQWTAEKQSFLLGVVCSPAYFLQNKKNNHVIL